MNKHFLLFSLSALAFMALVFISVPQADEAPQADAPSGVGPERAIMAANAKDGLVLSDSAIKALGIKSRSIPFQPGKPVTVPTEALVVFQEHTGIYRLRQGWLKLIDVEVVSKNRNQAIIQIKDLSSGDQIVTEGAPLLRLGELDIWSGGGDAD